MKIFDASFVQRREYMLYRLRDDHYPYNMQQYFEVKHYDEEKFKAFLTLMIRRHEILRTNLNVLHGQLKQVVRDAETFEIRFQYFDLREETEAVKVSFFDKHKAFQKSQTFNLERGPLFRIVVFSVEAALHIVLVTGHHVLFDDHSLKIFNQELNFYYASTELTDDMNEPVQYHEFSEWEGKLLSTDLGKDYRNFFNKQLVNGVPLFKMVSSERNNKHLETYLNTVNQIKKQMEELPFKDYDVVAPVARRIHFSDGGMITLKFSTVTHNEIWEFSKKQKVTLTAIFIGLFVKALHRLSGQNHFVVDIPVSHRHSRKFQNTIGWLALQGLCFIDIGSGMSDYELFKHTDARLYELYEHGVYPYESIGSHLNPPVGGDIPIFFNLSHMDGEQLAVESENSAQIKYGVDVFQQVALFAYWYPNGIRFELAYNNFLFDADQMAQLAAEYKKNIMECNQSLTSNYEEV